MNPNKASAPPSKARMNVTSIMAAVANAGNDGLQAANAFGNAASLLDYRNVPDLKARMATIISLLDGDDVERATRLLLETRSDLRRFCANLNRSFRCIEKGVRWHTGLHVQPGRDPLYSKHL